MLIGGNKKLCKRLCCSFVRNSAWLFIRYFVESPEVRGGMFVFPVLWMCLPRSDDFSSGMWHVHGRKLRLVSDCQFYLTLGNAAGNWVVGIADWFVIVIEAVNYMSTCRVRWVRNLLRTSGRFTSSIKGAFEVRKYFLVKDKRKRRRHSCKMWEFLVLGVVYRIVTIAFMGVYELNLIIGVYGWKLMFTGGKGRCSM
jgi:hypothetical protein